MHPGQGPGLSLHDLGETGGTETVTLLESEIPAHSHAVLRQRQAGEPAGARQPTACSAGRTASVYRDNPDNPVPLAPSAGPRRRRPAAQQHAALPDPLLLHRPAGRVPAEDLSR